MIDRNPHTIEKFVKSEYPVLRPGIGADSVYGYAVSARLFERWNGSTLISELSEDMLRKFIYFRHKQNKSAATANKDRAQLLTVWETATEFGFHDSFPNRRLVKKLKVPKRIPSAWSIEQIRKILSACERAEDFDGWTGKYWKALVLTIYDTSHRIGCLLEVHQDRLRSGFLTVSAELTKQNCDTVHRLHDQTIEALEELPKSELLFPWPRVRRTIHRQFRKILESAGLPATRRDLFHKIRRTSYTEMYSRLGVEAATKHAGHSCDLSRYYLDPTQIEQVYAADVLPRP